MAIDNKITNKEIAIANNEATLLGLFLRDHNAFLETAEIIKPEMFYYKENQTLYNAISNVHAMSKDFDISIFIDYLTKNKLEDKITIKKFGYDPLEYISWLVQNAGYYSELDRYIKILVDRFKSDQLKKLLLTNIDIIENKPFDAGELLSKLQLDLLNIDISEVNSTYEKIGNKADEVIRNIISNERSDTSLGLTFGFKPLDDLLLGANPGDLIILAARPSMGKTAFALNIAANVADNNKTVLFFSLEMSNAQLVQRMIAITSMIGISKLRRNALDVGEWKEIHWTKDRMAKWEMYLNDKPTLTLTDLTTLSRRFARTKKVDLVVVDYLQLISDSSRSNVENRQLEVSKISRALKQLARELECPVLSLSQLSRNVEKREDKTPILSDLRESGTIEQDADIVIFLHRKDYYNRKKQGGQFENDENTGHLDDDSIAQDSITDVIVAKNRHGAVGVVQLLFRSHENRFYYEGKKTSFDPANRLNVPKKGE